MEFPFAEDPKEAVIVCKHVYEGTRPILFAIRHIEDGMWHFSCGNAHDSRDRRFITLQEVYDKDRSIKELKDLQPGSYAIRSGEGEEWIIREIISLD
ncbi:hypothetical protein [Lagierella sp.]|uniref:hypothetical protein n=1 Tax=Lagierella sp. TaxID=2849657 RepID=UPI00260A9B38|nr:hypothetical protein [Lagierella sp.]